MLPILCLVAQEHDSDGLALHQPVLLGDGCATGALMPPGQHFDGSCIRTCYSLIGTQLPANAPPTDSPVLAEGAQPAEGKRPSRGPVVIHSTARAGWPAPEGNPRNLCELFFNRCRPGAKPRRQCSLRRCSCAKHCRQWSLKQCVRAGSVRVHPNNPCLGYRPVDCGAAKPYEWLTYQQVRHATGCT